MPVKSVAERWNEVGMKERELWADEAGVLNVWRYSRLFWDDVSPAVQALLNRYGIPKWLLPAVPLGEAEEEVKSWMEKALDIKDYRGGRADRINMLRVLIDEGELGKVRQRSDVYAMALALAKNLGYSPPPAYGKSWERHFAEQIADELGSDVRIIRGSVIIKPSKPAVPTKQEEYDVFGRGFGTGFEFVAKPGAPVAKPLREVRYRWEAKLDRKIWQLTMAEPSLSDSVSEYGFKTPEEAKARAPGIGTEFVSERAPYDKARVVSVQIVEYGGGEPRRVVEVILKPSAAKEFKEGGLVRRESDGKIFKILKIKNSDYLLQLEGSEATVTVPLDRLKMFFKPVKEEERKGVPGMYYQAAIEPSEVQVKFPAPLVTKPEVLGRIVTKPRKVERKVEPGLARFGIYKPEQPPLDVYLKQIEEEKQKQLLKKKELEEK